MKDFDYIIIGGGCAGLSLAYELEIKKKLKNKTLAIIDNRTNYNRDKTWSFWKVNPHNFDDCVIKNWKDFIRMWMIKFRAPILLNMKFDYNDLHSILIQVLPEEIWDKVLSFSQKVYIQSQTVKAESFQGSDADQQQIASYNKYNLVWKSLGSELIGPCGGSPSYFRRG